MESHDLMDEYPTGQPLTQIDFNLMICEALGLDANHVAWYQITGTGEDVTCELEWVPTMTKPADTLKAKFAIIPASEHTPTAQEILGHVAEETAFAAATADDGLPACPEFDVDPE